jgi:hypothetical protein
VLPLCLGRVGIVYRIASYRIVSYGARWAIAPGKCTEAPVLLPLFDRDGVSRLSERVGWVGSSGEVEVEADWLG